MTRSTDDGHSTVVTSCTAEFDPGAERHGSVAQPPPAPGLDSDLRELYGAYAAMVWRSLRRFGVPDVQLDDAVQDVFLIVHRSLAKFQHRSSIKTWLTGIALHVAKGYRRSQLRHSRRLDGLTTWLNSDAQVNESPGDATERRQANQLMHDLLATLPDELRDVLVLVELEEMTVREASEALGIRVRTGQRRLRAAVAAMSAAVANYLKGERS